MALSSGILLVLRVIELFMYLLSLYECKELWRDQKVPTLSIALYAHDLVIYCFIKLLVTRDQLFFKVDYDSLILRKIILNFY